MVGLFHKVSLSLSSLFPPLPPPRAPRRIVDFFGFHLMVIASEEEKKWLLDRYICMELLGAEK